MRSPYSVLHEQQGNCFEYATLLCSLLIGNGYDAYCVSGYASREVSVMDESRDSCPLLEERKKVSLFSLKSMFDVNTCLHTCLPACLPAFCCVYACIYVLYVRTHACMYQFVLACMYVSIYVSVYVCLYVCSLVPTPTSC